MFQSHGLTHISLAVRDLERTLQFYTKVFGVREYFRDASSVQVLGPGPHDVIAFEHNPTASGMRGGITHFGFRLQQPGDIDVAIAELPTSYARSRPGSREAPPMTLDAIVGGIEIVLGVSTTRE